MLLPSVPFPECHITELHPPELSVLLSVCVCVNLWFSSLPPEIGYCCADRPCPVAWLPKGAKPGFADSGPSV